MKIKLDIDKRLIGEQLKQFRRISASLEPNELQKIMKKHARITVRAAKVKVPVKEGDLKRSIGVKAGRRKDLRRGSVNVFIGPLIKNKKQGNDRLPAAWVEYGTSRANKKPYMRPAWQETREQVYKAIEYDMIAAIKRKLNG
jgi:HK97 gp10 family phage protein